MKTIKVGVIGAGGISTEHIEGPNTYDGAEVIAIADSSAKRVKTMAKEYSISRTYSSAEELIADREINAVSIAVPNKFHASYALAALKAGKHVLLEKPFAMNATEAKKVVAAAKAKRRIFTLGMNWRFMKGTQALRELVRRGDLGDVYHAKTTILRREGSPKFRTWFCRKDLAGGGALYDIGVHFLDMCLSVIDNFKPVAVSGATYCKFGPRGLGGGENGWGKSERGKDIFNVEDFGTALIKMKNGATVSLDASWVAHQENPGKANVEVYGTEGGASLCPVKLFKFGKKKGEYSVIEPQGIKLRYPHCNRFHNWLDAIAGRDKLEVKPEQALTVQKILDAIYKSSKTGREVRI